MIGVGQTVVDDDGDEQAEALVDARQMVALFVENIEANGARNFQGGFAAAFQRLDLHGAQGREGAGFHRAHAAGAGAVLADVGRTFQDAGTAALAADLHQAEGRDLAHLHAGAVVLESILQLLLDGPVVLRLIHVDEVDDDQAGQVAQAELARGFLGGLEVGLEGGGLDVPLTRGAAGVHVDGDQGLGLIDHQVAARAQGHDR